MDPLDEFDAVWETLEQLPTFGTEASRAKMKMKAANEDTTRTWAQRKVGRDQVIESLHREMVLVCSKAASIYRMHSSHGPALALESS